ncbi:VWA domain-containing protein [Pollutibacter soli]|uniref:vWA domain-containing protein n=1 Tax=Pollutibacter soli TaxID=3034157 RepID=UPI0030134EDF
MLKSFYDSIEFAYPQLLFLLLIVPILGGWYISRLNRQIASMKVSSMKSFHNTASWKRTFRHITMLLRLIAISAIIIAMARPQVHNDQKKAEGEGIDIVLCIDVSGSMLAQDFSPNRLEAAKQVAAEFVQSRPTDRFGLVIFAGESFTQCPITSDHDVVVTQIYSIRGGFMVDGTAIGSGLASSLDRLKTSPSKSKVVILLTDGENNGGLIDPKTAKEMARSLGIKVYTIGIGSEGFAPTPVKTPGGSIIMQREKVNIDEKLLGEIASATGGRYFRARGNEGLKVVYDEIDELEKTKVEIVTSRKSKEKFYPFAFTALVCLLLEVAFRFTVFRKFP